MGPVPPAFPCNGSERLWLCRWLEANAASLRELHVQRQEAEERVVRALSCTGEDNGLQWARSKTRGSIHNQTVWAGPVGAKSELGPVGAKSELGPVGAKSELGPVGAKSELGPVGAKSELGPVGAKSELQGDPGLVGDEQGHIQRDIEHNLTRLGALQLGQNHEDRDHFVLRGAFKDAEFPDDGTGQAQETHLIRTSKAEPCVTQGCVRRGATEPGQGQTGVEVSGRNQDWIWDKENLISAVPPDTSGLHRIGSGSWVPRLRLGSSGVTSDIIFLRRLSGNSLSTPSSGFCEASDIDSISSSCSSLCSEASYPTPLSMMSPRRNSSLRPRSTDCIGECRKDIQYVRGGAQRPMSAGALESSYFTSLSLNHSCFDITQRENVIPPPITTISPTLCVVQQRRRAERYIYKLALKYRCRPGAAPLPPDLGPTVHRGLASLSLISVCPPSTPPSPQCNTLSCSVGDVRKTPKNHGSWGKFLSRVMLRRDPRAASEMNLELCGRGNGTPLVENHLQRAKSVRDLFSVSSFKKSQKGLNKLH
ncbi:uncharacterized protein LOC100170590 isoform X1 [Xenopus tropicalis]|uniref:Uncharacterized protein LOC100170590 isoform X1 n=1 Tax=Xenopus tropicalis TaxID=8364 RepID=A0A8J0SB44_XENTR|nr:uncharacterized protein LOC100170590 isoform X1 [Xenopus tropicalis]